MVVEAQEPNLSARRARTRDALLQAGLQLFAVRSVDAVPIDDIVTAAGVAKGSFFNHFRDKQHFADVIATGIRRELEDMIGQANSGTTDPLERLTSGMMMAVRYALIAPDQTRVMLRSLPPATARDHPLNAGLRRDIEEACAQGLLRQEALDAGLLFWLGSCNMLMANMVERSFSHSQAAQRMEDLMVMALLGLGVSDVRTRELAVRARTKLLEGLRLDRGRANCGVLPETLCASV